MYRYDINYKDQNESSSNNNHKGIEVIITIGICVIVGVIFFKAVILKENNENNINTNTTYNRNISSETDDALPPYSPRENPTLSSDVHINISNTLTNNSNNEDLPPPKYEDIINETIPEDSCRILPSSLQY